MASISHRTLPHLERNLSFSLFFSHVQVAKFERILNTNPWRPETSAKVDAPLKVGRPASITRTESHKSLRGRMEMHDSSGGMEALVRALSSHAQHTLDDLP